MQPPLLVRARDGVVQQEGQQQRHGGSRVEDAVQDVVDHSAVSLDRALAIFLRVGFKVVGDGQTHVQAACVVVWVRDGGRLGGGCGGR